MMTSDAKRALARPSASYAGRSSCPICARRPSARISSRSTPRRRRFPRPRAPNARIEAWLDEQTRAVAAKARPEAKQRLFGELIKDAGATLLQRLVYLRLLETNGLRTVHPSKTDASHRRRSIFKRILVAAQFRPLLDVGLGR